ncbi:MAG TPA: DUF3048 domain-containing protein [Acidimicrobiales bacterium]|nr:DUF3048 domain-containing protein [Acidimicrobiales bacterium]
MRNPLSRLSRKQLGATIGAIIAAIGLVLGITLSQFNGPQHSVPSTTTVPPTTGPSVSTTEPRTVLKRCPLTDLRARSGVPDRPALAVKIGNEPEGARPQSGLNEADIVFDTPAEGFIMRYIAVYQCNDAASIGPTRSVRWVDWHLVRQFIHPILAFAGGINPNVDQVTSFNWLRSANLLGLAQAAGERIASRFPPDNLYTSTDALYRLFPKSNRPPKPVFTYSVGLPAGAISAKSLSIDFSYGTDVVWTWDPKARSWLHSYGGVSDVDALTHKPVTTQNVVVVIVGYRFGPYAESTGGSGDVESETLGRGVGYVLRNGWSIEVTWHRKYLISPFSFTRAHGEVVSLAPGRTWVELVPVRTAMSIAR